MFQTWACKQKPLDHRDAATFSLGKRFRADLVSADRRGQPRGVITGACREEEARMDLRMRLDVLAAIMSFGFIAAIVFGMI